MTIAESFIAEFILEATCTRRFLERFDDAHADWKPHEKSMTLAKLATHVVDMPNWATTLLDADDFDFATSDYKLPDWRTRAELIEAHDANTARFLRSLDGKTDEHMRKTWRMLLSGKVLEQHPRDLALRRFIVSHIIHHRGQLSVSYRLLGIPVPGAYGPSADENAP